MSLAAKVSLSRLLSSPALPSVCHCHCHCHGSWTGTRREMHGSHAMAAAEPPNSCGHPPLHVRPCAVRRRPATRLRSHVLSLPRGPHGLSPAAPGTEFPESLRGSSLPRGRKFKIFKSGASRPAGGARLLRGPGAPWTPNLRRRAGAHAVAMSTVRAMWWCTRFASQSRVN